MTDLVPRARRLTSFPYTFQSPSMGVRYAANVGVPPGFKAEAGRRYPALISTDGDWGFPGVNVTARSEHPPPGPRLLALVDPDADADEEQAVDGALFQRVFAAGLRHEGPVRRGGGEGLW